MGLKDQITEDMKAAMRAKDAPRLSAIRLLLAAIKQKEVDDRRELTDADVIAVTDKLIKQRRDSIAQFEAAGRHDLAAAEKFEEEILGRYLPAPASAVEIESAIAQAIFRTGAAGPKDMGRVMAELKSQLAGRADLSKVSALVKTKLAR